MAGATLFLAVYGNKSAGAERASTPTLPQSGPVTRAQVNAAAASWPLRFEENIGQIQGLGARDVRYISRGSAYTLFLTSTEAVLVLRQHADEKGAGKTSPVVVRMRLSGANQIPALTAQDELPGKSNYFIGSNPAKWRTGVANFGGVAVKGVYPGIDLVYHGNQGQLEYDFEVTPQADPKKIRFVLPGARRLHIDSHGDLRVKVEGGELRFRQPLAYQKADGAERRVPVRYSLKGNGQVAFRLAPYDTRQPLVIDPVLSYSTYLGGSSIDVANGIAVAPDGTAFIAGGTFSADFPTAHPLQPNAGGQSDFPQDGFVAKISADGSTLLYSTYLGGKNEDVANAIAVDAAGEAFVTGTTYSPDFPVPAGSLNTLCGGDGKCGASWNPTGLIVSNAFVTKLNVAGSALVYSTFLGNYENVQGLGIAVDGDKNAYVTGETGANITPTVVITPPATPPPPFPIVGGFQTTFGGGGTNAFITKIAATGTAISYSSYLGGSDEDAGYGIAVDSSGNAYVTGLADSTDFPVSATPLQSTNQGAGDAFLSKVNTTVAGAASLVYSTCLGGNGLDQGNGVAVDASGNAYVAGATNSVASSLGFTPPAGAFQTHCALDSLNVCEGDAFVAKLNPSLSGSASLLYFTYLGGSLADSGAGIAVDAAGDAYVTGSTVSPNFPVLGAFQNVYGGGNADAFVTELNPTGSALIYSTFLGGSNTDTGSGIAVDVNGGTYIAGQTCSLDFPLSNPLQATPGGNCDAFVSKVVAAGGVALNPSGLIFPNQVVGSPSTPQTVMLTNGGNSLLSITGIAVTGTDAGDFQETNTCGTSVPALGTCSISVTFTPTAVGTRTAQVTVTDNSPTPGSTQVVDLTGTGGNSALVSLSASSLAFGNQTVGVASSPQSIQVTNTGTAPLTITSAVASGDFAVQANNCTTAALVPTTTCTLTITFTPLTAGSSTGALTLTDNAPNSPQIILLTGAGVAQPIVGLSASTLSFGPQPLNTPSAAQTVTVTNTGTASLSLSSITATLPFAQTSTCLKATVAAGGICTISVTFTPTTAGSALGSLTLVDNAGNSPQVIALTGGGSDFGVSINPASATLVAGNTTNVTVTVNSVSGFNAAVVLACSGLPTLATCSASPASVTPSGTSATSSLTISTTRRTSTPPGGLPRPQGPGWTAHPGVWLLWALLLLGIGGWASRKNRRRWGWAALALTALWLASFAACGGSGSGYTNPTGTPAGTYTVTVTGTSAGLSHSTSFVLTVQ